jgi:tetratricopeptide (TPR) repeat protein
MRRWFIGSILILSTFAFILQSYGQEKFRNAGELYDSGMEMYYKGRYEEAIDRFSKLILFFPSSKSTPYSRYMIGQSYLKMGKCETALQQFDLYLKTYPNGDRVNEARKGIETCKEKLKSKTSPLPPPSPSPKEEALGRIEVRSLPEDGKAKRRICAQIFDFEEKSFENVERRVRELKQAGVNTLIVRVFQNRGGKVYPFVTPRHEEGVYFRTEYVPVVDDVLGKLAEIVHQNGLDLFAWMTTRYANYGMEENFEYRCKGYNFGTEKVEVARGFNLFHPDVLKRLEGMFRDLGRQPIDGILFQDDLILKHNEDFNPEASIAFLKEFGYLPHPDLFYIDPFLSESGKYYVKAYTERFWTWAHWKNRWLMNVAQRLMAAARESNPSLKFGINLYYETILNPSNGVAWFSQSLSEALEKKFDYYAVMAYHRQTMMEQNLDERKAMDLMAEVAWRAIRLVGDPHKVLMKVQTFDWNNREVIPEGEVRGVLAAILDQGPVSLAFAPAIDQFPFYLLKKKWSANK